MRTEEKILKATSEELYLWWLNARVTFAMAGGHGKANINEYTAKLYKEELVKRNSPYVAKCVDKFRDNEDFDTIAVFNGEGAV